jgi:hypothetical protein
MQEECWRLRQAAAPTGTSNVVSAWRLSGTLDLARLERAAAEVVRRHAVLCAAFTNVGGAPAAAVCRPTVDADMTVADLAGRSVAERERETERLVVAAATAQIDVAVGPLWRVMLPRVAAHEHALVVTLHPLAADERSGRSFVQQLAAIYSASPGADPRLPYSGVQYLLFAGVATRTKSQVDVPPMRRERAATDRRLVGSSTGAAKPVRRSASGPRMALCAPDQTTIARARRADRNQDPAAWVFQVLLSRDHDGNDVVVAATTADRTSDELAHTIGPFVRTLFIRESFVRADVPGGASAHAGRFQGGAGVSRGPVVGSRTGRRPSRRDARQRRHSRPLCRLERLAGRRSAASESLAVGTRVDREGPILHRTADLPTRSFRRHRRRSPGD